MLTLREVFEEYNSLVPAARELGYLNIKPWKILPPTLDHGMKRLNKLRNLVGLPAHQVPDDGRTVGAVLPLRFIQSEWNRLVPQAQERGIRVARWSGVPPTARHGMRRLSWLRTKLSTPAHVAEIDGRLIVVSDIAVFGAMTFGVEIECYMPIGMTNSALAMHIRSAGVSCNAEAYNHQVRPSWKLVSDASLSDASRGIEIVSPPLSGESGFSDLAKVCRVLESKGCKVSRKTGLHVHVGCRNESPMAMLQLAKNYTYFQNAIDSFLSPSRKNNNYAKRLPFVAEHERVHSMSQMIERVGQNSVVVRAPSRQRTINFQCLNSYGTVEFRQHQGSVELLKIENWVKFCMRMVIAARQGKKASEYSNGLPGLMELLDMPRKGREYFQARARHFAGERDMPMPAPAGTSYEPATPYYRD